MYSFIVFKYENLVLCYENHMVVYIRDLRDNWLIFLGIWGEAELILRIWGAKENTFRELRYFLSGI